MMRRLWPLAFITFKEGTRNKAFYGISLLAIVLMGASFFISGLVMRDVGKVAVDMAVSTVSFAGLLVVFFVGIDLMAKDLDKRTIYMVLARPISRQQYIIGKFVGISLLVVVTVFLLSVFAAISISTIKWANPDYFPRFSWGPVFLAEAFIALSLVLLSALSFLFASVSSTSFITMVLTILSYIIGQSLSSVKAIVESPQDITVSPVTVALVRAAYYIFPNLSLFDIKAQAAHSLAIPSAFIFWTVMYGLIYIVLVITFAALLFTKKEFP
jgi:ABC-type transport system involved in multi-copper enzyme maturation permease subunit